MTDFSALGIQVISYIGSSEAPWDITDLVAEISPIKTSPIELSGYFKIELSILLVSNTPGELETRFNNRWAIANKLELYVRNSLGVLTLHRTLRILDNFFDDGIGEDSQRPGINSLRLEIGDLFAQKDARYPNPGDIDIPRLANTPDIPVWQTCNYWLQVFGLPEITFLPGDEIPQDRITTTGLYSANSSVLEHIGQILYVNSRFALWVDPQERVRVRRVGLRSNITNYILQTNAFDVHTLRTQYYENFPETEIQQLDDADISYFLSEDDLLFAPKRSQSEREKVAGTVSVTGVSLFRYPYVDPPAETSTTSEAGVTISETFDINTQLLSRTTTKTGNTTISGLSSNGSDPGNIGAYEETTVDIYGGGIPGAANLNPVLPPYPALAPHLLSKTYTLKEQRPESGGSGLGAIALTKEIKTTYSYRNITDLVQGVLVRGVEISEILEVTKILPEKGSQLKINQTRKQNWIPLARGLYRYEESIVRPEDLDNRRYSKNATTVGKATPPAVEWAPEQVVNLQRQMYAQALFNYPPESPDNEHPRTYQVGAYADNNRALKLLAQQLGSFLIGRNEATILSFRPSDAWLADPVPAAWVALDYSATDDDLYLLDIPVLTLATKRAYLGGSGIYMGRRNKATGAITPPYGLGLDIWAYDFNTLVVDDADIFVRI